MRTTIIALMTILLHVYVPTAYTQYSYSSYIGDGVKGVHVYPAYTASVHTGNQLKVKGDIVGVKADIKIWEVHQSGVNIPLKDYNNKSRYCLKLNPVKEYVIEFSYKEEIKTLYVRPGTYGPYYFHLDIHFGNGVENAILEQKDMYDYTLTAME